MRCVSVKNTVIGQAPVLVCTVLEAKPEKILHEVQRSIDAGADLVEVRIDKLDHNQTVRAVLQEITIPVIVSCRSKDALGFFEGSEEERAERLMSALKAGADIIDVELTMKNALREMITKEARKKNIPLLIGYENLKETPDLDFLVEKAREIRDLEPDVAKIAVRANDYEDMISVLHLTLACNDIFTMPFAAIAIGKYGSASRPLACVLGSSMTYCTTKRKEEAPPGQLSVEDTRTVLHILS